jgi:hypothetical protein
LAKYDILTKQSMSMYHYPRSMKDAKALANTGSPGQLNPPGPLHDDKVDAAEKSAQHADGAIIGHT